MRRYFTTNEDENMTHQKFLEAMETAHGATFITLNAYSIEDDGLKSIQTKDLHFHPKKRETKSKLNPGEQRGIK